MNSSQNTPLIILKMRTCYPSLNPSLKKVAEFYFKNYAETAYMGISEIARRSGVSEATVTRFVRQFGYSGFKAFQVDVARSAVVDHDKGIASYEGIAQSEKPGSVCDKVINANIQALRDTVTSLDYGAVDKASSLIFNARNVIFYATGRSSVAANSARLRLYRLGINCFVYSDPHEQSVSSSLATSDDVVIGISNSGQTLSVVRSIQRAKDNNAVTVGITSFRDSRLASISDVCLYTSSNEPEISATEPTSSVVSQIVALDCLYMELLLKIPEDRQKFV